MGNWEKCFCEFAFLMIKTNLCLMVSGLHAARVLFQHASFNYSTLLFSSSLEEAPGNASHFANLITTLMQHAEALDGL